MPNQVIVTHPSIETIVVSSTGIKGDPGKGVIEGGTEGQVLTKVSDEHFDTAWVTPEIDATVIDYEDESGQLESTNVRGAITELSELTARNFAANQNTNVALGNVLTTQLNHAEDIEINHLLVIDTLIDLDEHRKDTNNPHETKANQVAFDPNGTVITTDNVQSALVEVDTFLANIGTGAGGRFLGVLELVNATTPVLPDVDGRLSGDYYFIDTPVNNFTWYSFTGLSNGDMLILQGDEGTWQVLKQAVVENDPIFRASPAFEISFADLTKWEFSYTQAVTDINLVGDTLTFGRVNALPYEIDLSKYNVTIPENIAFTDVANTFTENITVTGNVIATEFIGDGSQLTGIVPTVNGDMQTARRFVVTSNDGEGGGELFTQHHVHLDPSNGTLTAIRFVGDGAGITGVIENVEIGTY